jgi:hypothetical protein
MPSSKEDIYWTMLIANETIKILTNCISVDYDGPNGRTALHAATKMGDDGRILL